MGRPGFLFAGFQFWLGKVSLLGEISDRIREQQCRAHQIRRRVRQTRGGGILGPETRAVVKTPSANLAENIANAIL
jgi:hypothetical protein